MSQVIVSYRCACMIEEATLTVRERGPREDIVDWMEGAVQIALTDDHRSRSPRCRNEAMDYAKIFYDQDRRIGDASRRS